MTRRPTAEYGSGTRHVKDERHEWAVSRFGNTAGLFSVITDTGRNVFRCV